MVELEGWTEVGNSIESENSERRVTRFRLIPNTPADMRPRVVIVENGREPQDCRRCFRFFAVAREVALFSVTPTR